MEIYNYYFWRIKNWYEIGGGIYIWNKVRKMNLELDGNNKSDFIFELHNRK